jgi:signal transduction histidine kinase
VLLVILAGLSISSSLWVFDNLNIWTPILAPLVQTVVTFVIFQSFQLAEKSQQTWELEQEKKLLMEMEAMKNNFMSLVSHDLKTPLAKIQAVLETRLRTSDQSDITNDYSKLSAYTQELHRYIQAILQASRAEAQAFKLNLQAVDINEVVSRACRECMALVKERQVQFREELEPQFSVEVDPTLIYEVVLNLIENAVKYTPEGGSITVRTEEIDNFVVVTVVDSGEGIDPSEQTSVWNKFYRGKRHEIVTKGTGLGLYLVRYFVELHGGQVFLESQPGKGTRIGFRLPIADAAHGTENEMKE